MSVCCEFWGWDSERLSEEKGMTWVLENCSKCYMVRACRDASSSRIKED